MAKFNLGKVLESGLGILREFRNPSEPINTAPFVPDIAWPPNIPGIQLPSPTPTRRETGVGSTAKPNDSGMRNVFIAVAAGIGILVLLRILKVI